jgi:hypothetical protein
LPARWSSYEKEGDQLAALIPRRTGFTELAIITVSTMAPSPGHSFRAASSGGLGRALRPSKFEVRISARVQLSGETEVRSSTGGQLQLHWDQTGSYVAVFVRLAIKGPLPLGEKLGEKTRGVPRRAPTFGVKKAAKRLGGVLTEALALRDRLAAAEAAAAIEPMHDGGAPDSLFQGTRFGIGAGAARRQRAARAHRQVGWFRRVLGLTTDTEQAVAAALAADMPAPLINDCASTHAVHVVSARTGELLVSMRVAADDPEPAALALRVPLRRLFADRAPMSVARAAWGHRAFTKGDAALSLTPVLGGLGAARVHACTLSHDGRFVAAGGNGVLLIVDATTSEAVHQLKTSGWVMGLQWSDDDGLLAVGGHDKRVRIYETSSGIKLLEVGRPRGAWPLHLAFSPLGRALADGNREVSVHSCDGSRLPIRKHVDATALLSFPTPE